MGRAGAVTEPGAGSLAMLHLKTSRGVMSAEDREQECMKAIGYVLEFYNCEIAADVDDNECSVTLQSAGEYSIYKSLTVGDPDVVIENSI